MVDFFITMGYGVALATAWFVIGWRRGWFEEKDDKDYD